VNEPFTRGSKRAGRRRRPANPDGSPQGRPPPGWAARWGRARTRRRVVLLAAALSGVLVAAACGVWAGTPRAGEGGAVVVVWDNDEGAWSGASLLAASEVVDHPLLFAALLSATRPLLSPEPGPHLLTDDLTPVEVLRRLARLSSRARVRVVVPEGFNRFQIGERLERLRVCSARAFAEAATSPAELARAGVERGDSAEGFLFPATYDLPADSAAGWVLLELTAQFEKRLSPIREKHKEAFTRLAERYEWALREVITLASVIEKEAVRPEELPVIASVFYNRLDSADFRPARSLQSDPTAAYGCLVAPGLASCAGYTGRVTPGMLRDFENPYNTYRHPGLPPGPIANPGLKAIEAVLAPSSTDYLFFVATTDGRHAFSRTLDEHEAATRRPRAP
jgi:UPF0755 protein